MNEGLHKLVGDCPFCGESPVDICTVRNFIGVSIKATCSNDHHWTRQVTQP
jgi:hypothetical protein